MTTGFHQLALGDAVQLKGPLGSFIWNGQGLASWKGSDRKVKEVGMICGGSGMYSEGNSYFLLLTSTSRDYADFAGPAVHLP